MAIAVMLALVIGTFRTIDVQVVPSPPPEADAIVNWTEDSLRLPDKQETQFWIGGIDAYAKGSSYLRFVPQGLGLPGHFRVRLGDTVPSGGDAPAMLYAAIYDDRLLFRMPHPPVRKSEISEDSTVAAAEQREDMASGRLLPVTLEFAQVEVPPGPAPQVRVRVPTRPLTPESPPSNPEFSPGSPQETQKPPGSAPRKESQNVGLAAKAGLEVKTIPEVIRSALTTALLQADAGGRSSIAFPLWTVEGRISVDAVTAIRSALRDRLSSIRHIYLYDPNINPPVAVELNAKEEVPTALERVRFFATPLPLRGGQEFIVPRPGPHSWHRDRFGNETPGYLEKGDWQVNPIYGIPLRSTFLPALAYIAIGFFALLVGRMRFQYRGFTWRGMLDGAALTVGLVITLTIIWSFWRSPQTWFTSVSGLTCVGLLVGAIEGGLLTLLRPVPQWTGESNKQSVRYVLRRDVPIADLNDDRLNFTPLIDALRLFLDNPDTAPPVVLSVNGPWGSGKSSVMKMLELQLRRTDRFRIVWFNAWQYSREEQIMAAFLQTIAAQLSQQWRLGFALRLGWTRWKKAGTVYQLAVLTVVALLVAGLVDASLRTNLLETSTKFAANDLPGGLAGLLGPTAKASAIGAVIWCLNLLWPFRRRFRDLFAVRDQRDRVGFIDEFMREFRLYREAVGERKFLFLIDDLDRCQPDSVIEVLKTINLIINSAEEAGRSFFILGYDQEYIVRAIELHFHDFAESARKRGESFGLQYLKKMVTISISVPIARPEDVEALVKGERAATKEKESQEDTAKREPAPASRLLDLIESAVQSPWWRPALGAIFLVGALASILVLRQGQSTSSQTDFEPKASDVAMIPKTLERATVDLPSPDLPASLFDQARWLALPALLMLISAAGLYVANRPPRPGDEYRTVPRDSPQFVDAIDHCKGLLPTNPRDAIRLVNLMRMEYLIQSGDEKRLAGIPLDEWECVSLTLLEKRHMGFFQPSFVERRVLPLLEAKAQADVMQVFSKLDAANGEIAADVGILIKAHPQRGMNHLANPEKLRRYVDLNRFLLASEEDSAPSADATRL